MLYDAVSWQYLQTRTIVASLMTEDQGGQGMVEYALLLVLVSVVSVGIMTALGHTLTHEYSTIANAL